MTGIALVFNTLHATGVSCSILEQATVMSGIVPAYCAH